MDLYLFSFFILSFAVTISFFHFVMDMESAIIGPHADLDLPLAIAGVLVAGAVAGFLEPFTAGHPPALRVWEPWFFGVIYGAFTPFVLLWLWFVLKAIWEHAIKPVIDSFWETPFNM